MNYTVQLDDDPGELVDVKARSAEHALDAIAAARPDGLALRVCFLGDREVEALDLKRRGRSRRTRRKLIVASDVIHATGRTPRRPILS